MSSLPLRPLVAAAALAVACSATDDPVPVDRPDDQTSAAICAVSFDDVRAAWNDFAPARTFTVCADATCDAPTVAAALDLACDESGDDVDISVAPGVYPEALEIDCPGQRLRLRGAHAVASGTALAALPASDRAVLDGAYRLPTDCSPRDHGALFVADARAIWIEGLELRGYHRSCAHATAHGLVIEGSDAGLAAVRVRANYIHDLGVACPGGVAACDGELNAHGILVLGDGPEPLRNVHLADNLLEDLALGQSEALAVNGHVERYVVEGNIVRDVDNIAYDLIGFENDLPWRAREGLVADNAALDLRCGNPTYASDLDNAPCPSGVGRWPAAAGIYVDGAHGVCVRGNTVRAFDRGLEVAAERGRGDQRASAIALCTNTLEASREHAFAYGGDCAGGSNGARDVRLGDNAVVCPTGDLACAEVSRDESCTTPLLCGGIAACPAAPPAGALLRCAP